MDRRLGRPLPHQLPNPTRANPLAINLSPEGHIRYYSQFPEAIPYQRVCSHALLTRPPLSPKTSLDLHVLGLPPAFILSQDQTLKLKCISAYPWRRTFAHLFRYISNENNLLFCALSSKQQRPQNSEACHPYNRSKLLKGRYASVRRRYVQTAHISLQIYINVKEQRQKTNITLT